MSEALEHQQPHTGLKLKITHSGGSDTRTTKIVNAATGEPLDGVTRIELTFDANDGVSAIVYIASIANIELDVAVEALVVRKEADAV